MKSPPAISLASVSKVYRLYESPIDRLKEALHPLRRRYSREFHALDRLSFEVPRGETFGIVGKNGSGKSTLLKLITGVLTPTSGQIAVRGRVSALLELGAGFNPEYTGLENIFFNGVIHGYSREEIAARLDSIVAFADIGEYLDQPVKLYSSGMFVRLGFSVAIHVDPQILVVDEALSVGDIRFQQKCLRKIDELRERGTTILVVSHDLGAIRNFCSSCLWLQDGAVAEIGTPESVVKSYSYHMSYGGERRCALPTPPPPGSEGEAGWSSLAACSSHGEGGALITGLSLRHAELGHALDILRGREPVTLSLRIEVKRRLELPIIGFILHDMYGNAMLGFNNDAVGRRIAALPAGACVIARFSFRFPRIKSGHYTITVAVAEGTQESHLSQHWVYDAAVIQVVNDDEIAKFGFYFVVDEAAFDLQSDGQAPQGSGDAG